ncbi:hypothetical protein LCGC14_1348250 [marine sediment metagenome]|uniref:Uncharacterized protein n=1 Tax=marine sediment metagenome TaxID=412755 RepID=A0A0F9KXN3_9ZZZZ
MYYETGVSSRVPFRVMFDSKKDSIADFNKYKEFSNVYHSIYGFRETEKIFDRVGPNYETAHINRVVLDLDSYIKHEGIEYYTENGSDSVRKVEKWTNKLNLLRQYRFSGGGFYAIFSAKGHPLKLRDFEINLQNKLDIHIDESTIGDTARMMRVTNSFNFKNYRRCYCIPVTIEELDLPFEKIRKLAQKPRINERYIYGKETYDFSNSKIDQSKIRLKKIKIDLKENVQADDILTEYGWEQSDFCNAIKMILSKGHIGNYLRFELIKYFKTVIGISLEDNIRLIVSLLKHEGKHSFHEKQAIYAYRRNYVFNPQKLKGLGYCLPDCNKSCMGWRYLGRKLKDVIENGL